MRVRRLLIGLVIAAALAGPAAAQTADRLYVMDCGHNAAKDQARWSPGVNVGKPIELSDVCYLIKHGAQWLLWEEQANFAGFRTTTDPVAIEVAAVPARDVAVKIARGAPGELVTRFVSGGRVSFPKHPLNQDRSVAFSAAPAAERWAARFTSSRTLAVADGPGGSPFALKRSVCAPPSLPFSSYWIFSVPLPASFNKLRVCLSTFTIEIVTGTLTNVSPNPGTLPVASETPLANDLPATSRCRATPL